MKVGADATQVTCEYCGAEAQVQRRTALLRRPQPLPAPAPGQRPLRVAVEQGGRTWWTWLLLGIIVLAMASPCVLGPIFWLAERSEKAAREALRRASRWDGGGVVLRDLNRDGVQDVIGHMRRDADTQEGLLTAIDGASGKVLWHCSLGAYRPAQLRDPIGVLGHTMVRANGGANLIGVDLLTGRITWRRTLDENIRGICAGPDPQTVAVQTADDELRRVAAADGALGPAAKGECDPVEGVDPESDQPDRLLCKSHGRCAELVVREAIDGMRSDLTLHRPSAGLAIALGHKHPGTAVPMLARYSWPPVDRSAIAEHDEALAGHTSPAYRHHARAELIRRLRGNARPVVAWKATVPAASPLTATTGAPDDEVVDLTDQAVVAAYQDPEGERHWHLTAFAIADGRRLWDVDTGSDDPVRGVKATPTHALISFWTSLVAYELKTGKRAFAVSR